MVFSGKKYLVISQFRRCNTLFLRCVEELGGLVSTFPATITDFPDEPNPEISELDGRTHFTIQALNEVAYILDKAQRMST